MEAPGATLVGAQASADGVAVMDLWYDGEAVVHGQGWKQTIDLDAMYWQGVKLFGHITEVSASRQSSP